MFLTDKEIEKQDLVGWLEITGKLQHCDILLTTVSLPLATLMSMRSFTFGRRPPTRLVAFRIAVALSLIALASWAGRPLHCQASSQPASQLTRAGLKLEHRIDYQSLIESHGRCWTCSELTTAHPN